MAPCVASRMWEALGSEVHLGPFRLSAESAFHFLAASGAASLNFALSNARPRGAPSLVGFVSAGWLAW
jgi:hypothetical protein